MSRRSLVHLMVAAIILLSGYPALAENRLALVIGQSAYRSVPALPNPANDARAMTQLLSDSGFEVLAASDLSQDQLRQKVSEFARQLATKGPDTVALVFYAGHGLQIDGENYLVPVDIDVKREADIPIQAVRLNDILNTLTSVPSKMRILLLDACRNNPFPEINKTAGHGLAIIDAKTGSPGTFVSFSTSPGAEAEDGNGSDSPYTTALLAAARQPGLPIEETLKRVRLPGNRALDERLRNRLNIATTVAAVVGGAPGGSGSVPSNPIGPTNISLPGPTCPCNALPSPVKKVDVPKAKDSSPPKRADKQPPKRARGSDDDVVVYRRPPPPDMYEPAPSIGIGIGIGGGFGGGERGGGMPGRRGGY